VSPTDPQKALDDLAEEIRAHKGAGCGFEVCETCTQLVPGTGPASAEIVIVGEAPGAREDAAGVPFVGAAGKLLDTLLAEAQIPRDAVFITNVVKARPPRNRDPKRDEVAHHWPWLERQLEIIEPQLLVPLGRHALARFAPDAKIAEVHGTALTGEHGRRLFPLYHPAAALYNGSLRATLFADAQALRAALS
jgi:uracil-DNA glycosylase family 4